MLLRAVRESKLGLETWSVELNMKNKVVFKKNSKCAKVCILGMI